LRNPDAKTREYVLDVGTAFELPLGAPRRYRAGAIALVAGRPELYKLGPFEVRTIEALPVYG
jgi:hypothetical protein